MVSAFQALVALRHATESAQTSTSVARLPVGNIDRREKTLCMVHGREVSYDGVGVVVLTADVVIRLHAWPVTCEILPREPHHVDRREGVLSAVGATRWPVVQSRHVVSPPRLPRRAHRGRRRVGFARDCVRRRR